MSERKFYQKITDIYATSIDETNFATIGAGITTEWKSLCYKSFTIGGRNSKLKSVM